MTSFFNLSGKTALITGAFSGLGEQFAHVLAEAGAPEKRQRLEQSIPLHFIG